MDNKKNEEKIYQRIAHIALVVDDYDDAIEFYTKKLDFRLLEDTKLSDEKRWVMIAPQGSERMLFITGESCE